MVRFGLLSRWDFKIQQMNHLNKDTLLEALSVALQHPALAADQQNVCRLLQTCKTWRKALHQSSACVTDVSFKQVIDSDAGGLTARWAADLARFGHWMSLYAGGIRSIDLDIRVEVSTYGREREEFYDNFKALAQHVLASGLKAAAATPATPTTAAASSVLLDSCPPDTTLLQPLRLQSFTCSSDVTSPLVLSALPAATLTHLNIAIPSTVQVHEQLGRLSSLRSLELKSLGSWSSDYFSIIGKLSQLTHLALRPSTCSSCMLQMLPKQLKKLELRIRGSKTQHSADISHMSQLQHLRVDVLGEVAAFVLPQQLEVLDIRNCSTPISTCNIISLQQLQELKIDDVEDTTQDLLSLRQLPQLTSIDLTYKEMTCALDAAPAWSQLQHLAALRLEVMGSEVEMDAIVAAVCLLSSITTLHLDLYVDQNHGPDAEVHNATSKTLSTICQSLMQVTQLQDLRLNLDDYDRLQKDDVLHLRSFTGLTSLSLQIINLNDINVIAVLLTLTGLQQLTLGTIQGPHTLPVIGRLHELTALTIHGLSQQQQVDSFKYLTGLCNLRKVWGFGSCSETDIKQFRIACAHRVCSIN